MTLIKVFHNPTAGEAEHTKEMLVKTIESAGFECSYSSTKKEINEKSIPESTDIVAVAGGDGTVRKIAEYYCSGNMLNRRHPLGLLPWGTANNIARTLGIEGKFEQIVESWKAPHGLHDHRKDPRACRGPSGCERRRRDHGEARFRHRL